MSIFYTNSSKSRDFSYQNAKSNAPLEIKGNSKRSIAPPDSLRISTEPESGNYRQRSSRTPLNHEPDTRRTLNPTYDKENQQNYSSRGSHQNVNKHPGSMLTLFNKSTNDGEKYDRLRRNKVNDVSAESLPEFGMKRQLKTVALKETYDYKTGISTLPLTSQIREEKPKEVVRNYTTAYLKEKYDLTSAINTLPGAYNQRNDEFMAPISSKKHAEPKFSNNNRVSSGALKAHDRNVESNSSLNQNVQINPMSKPFKVSVAKEQLYSRSKQEYFGLMDNPKKSKPAVLGNAFRSSIDFR